MKYSKKIDGVYYVAETACESRYRKLWVLSAYIGKNKRDTFTEAVDVTGPGLNVQNALPSQVSREGTVSQDSEPVNKYSIKEAEENATDKALLRENEHFFHLRPLHGGRPAQNTKHPLSIRMHPAEPEARQESPHPAGVPSRPASLPSPSSARRPLHPIRPAKSAQSGLSFLSKARETVPRPADQSAFMRAYRIRGARAD